MLRIVLDARSVSAKKSGVGNYVEALLCHMLPMADDMRFLVLRQPSETVPIVDHERVEEVHFAGDTKSIATVVRLGRKLGGFESFDLYHAPSELVPLGLRCPWVVTIHDLMWVEAPWLASAFLPVRVANGLWYRANIRRAIAGARGVIAISAATRSAIGRVYPAHADKTHVVHHGIDLRRHDPSRACARSGIDHIVPPGIRYSLVVGQGSPYKNHHGMVRAFVAAMGERNDHKLVLLRRFTRVDFGMTRLLARPEVRDRVIDLPFVSDAELLGLYRHAHMLLFASHYEGFGMPALEAMALGTPVLGSTASAVREVTGDAALHADPSDHADLVRKLRQLDGDDALRRRLTALGRARAASFSWSRAAQQTLEVYRRAAGGA